MSACVCVCVCVVPGWELSRRDASGHLQSNQRTWRLAGQLPFFRLQNYKNDGQLKFQGTFPGHTRRSSQKPSWWPRCPWVSETPTAMDWCLGECAGNHPWIYPNILDDWWLDHFLTSGWWLLGNKGMVSPWFPAWVIDKITEKMVLKYGKVASNTCFTSVVWRLWWRVHALAQRWEGKYN